MTTVDLNAVIRRILTPEQLAALLRADLMIVNAADYWDLCQRAELWSEHCDRRQAVRRAEQWPVDPAERIAG